MEIATWLVFLAAILLGSYVQAVAGFAMGMIIMAVCGATTGISLAVLTAVVSLVSGVNIVVSLKGHLASIDRSIFFALAIGQLPAILLGVWLVTVFDREARWLLYLALGMFITLSSISMMFKPVAQRQVSNRWACFGVGFSGGLMGGLFAASGPVIGWFFYRQPLAQKVIRATLLATFALSTGVRTIVVGSQGGITFEVLWLSAGALPCVLLGAWLGRIRPPNVSDNTLKRCVFALLFLLGSSIIRGALAG